MNRFNVLRFFSFVLQNPFINMGNEFDDIVKGFCPIFYHRILRRSDDFSSEKMAGHTKFKTEISTLDIF